MFFFFLVKKKCVISDRGGMDESTFVYIDAKKNGTGIVRLIYGQTDCITGQVGLHALCTGTGSHRGRRRVQRLDALREGGGGVETRRDVQGNPDLIVEYN